MMLLRFVLATLFFSLLTWGGVVGPARGQSAPAAAGNAGESAEETKERVTAERFLQLLKSRPRLGTALDKVYGYHVGRGTLNEFCDHLASDAEKTGDGKLWMILGMVEMQRGEDAAAAESLKKAQELLPEEPLASYYLGKTLVLMGDVEGAAAAMRAAIKRKPPRADLLAILQDLGRIFQRTGQTDEALAVWKELEESFPGDPQVKEEIARILAEEGVLEGAIERYTDLAKSEKDRFRQVEMSIRAAQLKAQLGQTEVALADFEGALAKVNPDSWLHRDIRRRIEEVFWSSGDIDGLLAYYTAWVEKHPDDVDAMMRTARFLAVQHRLPEAEGWFRKAIERAPSKIDVRMALVEALVAEGQYAKAAKEMEVIAKIEPDNPDTIVRWGELVLSDTERTDSERKQQSVEIWKKLLAKGADNAVTVARVADLLRGAEATEEAIAQYQRAIELAPGEPQYREYLGEYLHQLGRKDQAVAVWQELARGDRRTRDNLVRLSEVFSTFGHGEQALEAMAEACGMQPTFGHRARYAELLREAERYDESLAQLDLAEPLAEDAELLELVMQERIKNYQASDTLAERIDEAQAEVKGPKKAEAAAWRRLALLLEADRKFQPACEAAQKATTLEPGNAAIWTTTAALQERSGQFGEAIESYRKLATIDRRYLSNYLTQIASLEMRLGNTEGALKAGEQLIASAPGNTEHYRFFAELCFQVGEEERGLDVLRRSMRSNPSDSDAMLYLAGVLSEAFRTDEAIELYWRTFDLATDLEGKTSIIAPLTELYLRTNRFETLTERLEATGRQQNKPREGLLWVAAAHQAAGDLGTAKLMLEQLVREESRDTKLLEQLVALSRAEYDFESAAEYQKRLVAIAPSIEAEYVLANILLDLGEIDQSEALWLKLAQRKSDSRSVVEAIGSLIAKDQYETAAAIVDKSVTSEPENWELLAQAMVVYLQAERHSDATRIAERVLSMNVDPGEPTQQYKKLLSQRGQHQPQAYGYRENLQSPMRQMQTAMQLRSVLGMPDAEMYYGSQQTFTPLCFGDVQTIAHLMPFAVGGEEFDAEAFFKQQTDEALANPTPEKLWRAILFATWQNPRAQYGGEVGEEGNACLERLVELEDPYAAAIMISQFRSLRYAATNDSDADPEPLKESELAQIKEWNRIVQRGNTTSEFGYFQIWVAGELARAGQSDEAERIVDDYIDSVKEGPQAGIATLQALSVLLATNGEEKRLDPKLTAKCRDLFQTALSQSKASTGPNSGYGSIYSSVISQLILHDQWDQAMECASDVIEWQAQQTAELRPSQRERLDANPTPLYYHRSRNGSHQQVTISFPPPSSYFGSESIYILYELYNSAKEDKQQLARVKSQIDQWAEEPSDDPYLRLTRFLAKASFEHWNGDARQAETTLATAEGLQLGGQFVSLALARLYHERGATREALGVIERLKPTNQGMLVERELAILQLVLQLGDLDRARQSAQKLFAMRLPSETEFKLADLMYQLGMTELGDRMMSRISRRAGGKQETLVELMTRYAMAGKNEEAAEIARQIIRRTEPRGSSRSYNSGNRQHQQALQVLARAGELEKLIEQYEALVERSPKSSKLVDQLASFYEAAGRRDDALKLQTKAADKLPSDPRNLLAAAKQLARAGKHKEASEKYIAALVKTPELLNNEYYEMEASFTPAKMWGKLADAMVETGLEKFRQSYRMDEIFRELVQQKETGALNNLLKAGIKDLSLDQLSQLFYSSARSDFKLDPEVAELLVKKLESDDFIRSGTTNYNYVYSRGSGGRTTGFINGMARILHQDQALEDRAIEIVSKRLEKLDHLVDRILLAMIYAERKDMEGVREVVEPLIAKKKKSSQEVEAIWSIASQLTHVLNAPDLACELLESVEPSVLFEDRGSSFEYSAMALLAEAYRKANRNSDARRILVEHMMNMEVDAEQDQFNPGYGEYQYISSQAGLARSFLAMGYPAEAFIAFRKAYADETRLERASRWGGMSTRQRDSLAGEIANATTPEFILQIVRATLGGEGEVPTTEVVEMASWLTSPEVKQLSLVDVQVTMPLEEFAHKFAEDKKLKRALVDWLELNPIDPDQEHSLKALVTRLLLCTAVEDNAGAEATSKAIMAWDERHKAASDDAPPADAGVPNDQKESGEAKESSKELAQLPEELLLGMAAMRMPSTVADDASLARLYDRVIAVAQNADQPALVTGLKCQLARRVAKEDPEQARTLLLEVLEDILPGDQPEATEPAPATP